MGLKLTIDQGNSSAKLALWEADRVLRSWRSESVTAGDLSSVDFDSGIYASVRREKVDLPENVLCLSTKLPLPLKIEYSTPETLGADRIGAAAGALVVASGKAALVVDVGTAVTYDFVTGDCRFAGGNIAAGIEMRLQSLAEHTSALPEVGPKGAAPLLGHDTTSAMRAGAIRGVAAEIEYYYSALNREHGKLELIITGGSSELVVPYIATPFIHEPNLVMIGLKRILDYNEAN